MSFEFLTLTILIEISILEQIRMTSPWRIGHN